MLLITVPAVHGVQKAVPGAYSQPDGQVLVIRDYNRKMYVFFQNGEVLPYEEGFDTSQMEHIPLVETLYNFPSGDLVLRGKLVTPADEAYRGSVILVQGSDADSAVDNNYLSSIFAAHGLAAFVYDKRGTGRSQGSYTGEIEPLADDLVAAIDFVESSVLIKDMPLLLAGFSQGGWVAPLASTRSAHVDGVLVAYGPAVSIQQEDRWGYAYWMQHEGYTAEDLAKADAMHEVLMDMRSRGRPDRWDELNQLIQAQQSERWYRESLPGTDSSLSALTDSPVPLRLMYWWTYLFGLEKFTDYDPAPALSELHVPSYWLFAAEDSSQPTQASVAHLKDLAATGLPISYKIYPDTEHGIFLFEQGESRQRIFESYHPDYYSDMLYWLKSRVAEREAADP